MLAAASIDQYCNKQTSMGLDELLYLQSEMNTALFIGGIQHNSGLFATNTEYDLVVYRYDSSSGTARFIVNNQYGNSYSVTPESSDGSILFATSKDVGTQSFFGRIDDVAFFPKTLSDAEVTELNDAVNATSGLYAIGGLDTKTITKFNEKYDLATDVWTDVEAMPTPRFGMSSASVNGKIYVVGGAIIDIIEATLSTSGILESYDIIKDEWETLTSIPFEEDGPVGIAYSQCNHVKLNGEDYLYVLGGSSGIFRYGRPRKLK